MISLKINTTTIKNWLEYLMIACMLLGSNSMLERDQKYNITANSFFAIFSLLCIVLAFANIGRTINREKLSKVIIITVIASLCIFVPHSNIEHGLIQWVIPIFSCSLYMALNPKHEATWQRYVNVMATLSVISLFFYIGGTLFGLIKPSEKAYFLYDGILRTCNSYYGLYYEAQKTQFASSLFQFRNCGIFIESPMYNGFLCLALSAELSINKYKRKWVIVLLTITILSTWATTGLLFLLAVIAIRLYTGRESSKKNELRVLVLPIIVLAVAYIALSLVSNKVQTKSGEASLGIRLDHIIAFMKMWIHRPLFGYSYDYISTFYNYTKYQVGYSVGLPVLLGRNGIFMFMTYIVPWWKGLISSLKKTSSYMYYWIGSFIVFFMTAIIYEPVFIFALCAQVAYTNNEEDKEDKEDNRESA